MATLDSLVRSSGCTGAAGVTDEDERGQVEVDVLSNSLE